MSDDQLWPVAVVENFFIWQPVAVAVGPNMAQQLDPTGPHISSSFWQRCNHKFRSRKRFCLFQFQLFGNIQMLSMICWFPLYYLALTSYTCIMDLYIWNSTTFLCIVNYSSSLISLSSLSSSFPLSFLNAASEWHIWYDMTAWYGGTNWKFSDVMHFIVASNPPNHAFNC